MSTFDEAQHSRDNAGKFSIHVGAEQEGSLAEEPDEAGTPYPMLAPGLLSSLARRDDPGVRASVAHHPRVDAQTLHSLRHDVDDTVRRGVTSNANTDPLTLSHMDADPDPGVRLRVAQNPNTDAETLDRLSVRLDAPTMAAVAGNPKAKPRTLNYLGSDDVQRALGHDAAMVRFRLENNPSTSLSLVRKLKAQEENRR